MYWSLKLQRYNFNVAFCFYILNVFDKFNKNKLIEEILDGFGKIFFILFIFWVKICNVSIYMFVFF